MLSPHASSHRQRGSGPQHQGGGGGGGGGGSSSSSSSSSSRTSSRTSSSGADLRWGWRCRCCPPARRRCGWAAPQTSAAAPPRRAAWRSARGASKRQKRQGGCQVCRLQRRRLSPAASLVGIVAAPAHLVRRQLGDEALARFHEFGEGDGAAYVQALGVRLEAREGRGGEGRAGKEERRLVAAGESS